MTGFPNAPYGITALSHMLFLLFLPFHCKKLQISSVKVFYYTTAVKYLDCLCYNTFNEATLIINYERLTNVGKL